MGGTSTQFSVGKVSLSGHSHSRALLKAPSPLSDPSLTANNVRSLARKTAIGLAAGGPGPSPRSEAQTSA